MIKTATATGAVTYAPQLDPAELTHAADALFNASAHIKTRAAAAHIASGELTAT